jgi:hypothetical protein
VKPQAEIPKCGCREFETDRQYGGSTLADGAGNRVSLRRKRVWSNGARQNATLNFFGMHSAVQCRS